MATASAKYFKSYAEPEAQRFTQVLQDYSFDDVIVVPAKRESETISRFFSSLKVSANNRDVLLILVVNATESCPPSIIDDNRALIKSFSPEAALATDGLGSFVVKDGSLTTLVVDRSNAPYFLDRREGVGRARKIGSDIAASLIFHGIVRGPFIYSTDADAFLPPNYFEQIPNPSKAVAYIFPFSHEAAMDDPNVKLATKIYELFMAYYRNGLGFAGSSYAFHTIGSTIAVRAESYIHVRGFPVREAGEDFYLLNKLRKLGHIKELNSKPILLSGRLSDRVPFGTGASIRKYIQELSAGRNVLFYDPEVFWTLRSLLESFNLLNEKRSIEEWKDFLLHDERRGPWILRALADWDAFTEFKKILASTTHKKCIQQELMTWFDAFRTLKFIHHLRDSCLPSIPWFEALQRAPFETTGRKTSKEISDVSIRRVKQ